MKNKSLVFTLKVNKDILSPNIISNLASLEVLEVMQKMLENLFGNGNVYAELNEENGAKNG